MAYVCLILVKNPKHFYGVIIYEWNMPVLHVTCQVELRVLTIYKRYLKDFNLRHKSTNFLKVAQGSLWRKVHGTSQ